MKWKEVELGNVVDKIIGGGTPSKAKPDYWNGDIYWASVKDMKEGRFQLSETKNTITELGLQNSSTNVIPTETIITSTRMGLGRAFINLNPMAINQDLKAIFPNNDIEKKFLFWALISKAKNIEAIGRGSTVKGIRVEDLKAVKIPFPSLPIQQKIASILSAYDDLIENNLRRIELLEQSARELYKEWFVRFKFPEHKKVKFVDGLPEGWERKKLGEISDNNLVDIIDGDRGKNYPNRDEFSSHGYCIFLNKKNLKDDRFYLENSSFINEKRDSLLRKGKLERNDIVLTTRGTIGGVALYNNIIPYEHIRINSGMLIIRPQNMNKYFLYYTLKSDNSKNQYKTLSSGAAQPQLPIKSLINLDMILPTQEIQEEVSHYLSKFDNLIENMIFQNNLLKQARDLLLPKLMKGEIDV